MSIMHVAENCRFYHPTGEVAYEVPSADGKKQVAPTITHARKLQLLPSVTEIKKVRANRQLSLYMQEQILYAALTTQRMEGESDEHLVYRIMQDADAHSSQARDRGKEVHAGIQALFKGEPCNDPAAIRAYETIKAKLDSRGVRYKAICEHSFARPDLGFAGTTDLWVSFADGVTWVFDHKTNELAKFMKNQRGVPFDDWKMQLSAYRLALDLPQAMCFQSVIDRESGETLIIEHTDSYRWERAFIHLLHHWFHANNYYPEHVELEDKP